MIIQFSNFSYGVYFKFQDILASINEGQCGGDKAKRSGQGILKGWSVRCRRDHHRLQSRRLLLLNKLLSL